MQSRKQTSVVDRKENKEKEKMKAGKTGSGDMESRVRSRRAATTLVHVFPPVQIRFPPASRSEDKHEREGGRRPALLLTHTHTHTYTHTHKKKKKQESETS